MLNMDFSQRIVVDSLALPWQASPSPLVWRRQLERAGGECARATSIVRYDPGARFPEHGHEFGEEIIVLDGVFSDQHGDHQREQQRGLEFEVRDRRRAGVGFLRLHGGGQL